MELEMRAHSNLKTVPITQSGHTCTHMWSGWTQAINPLILHRNRSRIHTTSIKNRARYISSCVCQFPGLMTGTSNECPTREFPYPFMSCRTLLQPASQLNCRICVQRFSSRPRWSTDIEFRTAPLRPSTPWLILATALVASAWPGTLKVFASSAVGRPIRPQLLIPGQSARSYAFIMRSRLLDLTHALVTVQETLLNPASTPSLLLPSITKWTTTSSGWPVRYGCRMGTWNCHQGSHNDRTAPHALLQELQSETVRQVPCQAGGMPLCDQHQYEAP